MFVSLGTYWEEFIKNEIESGRYTTASEVSTDALRALEIRGSRLSVIREHLAEGAYQAAMGRFKEGFDIEAVIERASNPE